jgi:transcriptional regulator with XRE-family HTH domain
MTYTFSETMRQRMEAKSLDVGKLAERLGCSFEHARKLCNSETFPSPSLRDKIADVLESDRTEFEEQVNADRWRSKYKKIPAVAEAKHPIYSVWNELTKDQQTSLLCMARCLAKQRKGKHSSAAA